MDIQRKHNIKAKKSLGQNFLKDEKVLEIIASHEALDGKNIIEIGPGYGALSEKIVKKNPKSFCMIELDNSLVDILNKRIDEEKWDTYCSDIQLIHQDILTFTQTPHKKYMLIANIPYYITSPILRHFLYEIETAPESMIILMQKDVADKILRQYHPKKPKSSVLSLYLAKKSNVHKVVDVRAEYFDPIPKVDSTVLHFKQDILFPEIDDADFLDFIKKAFGEPRKKLVSNLLKNTYNKEDISDAFDVLRIDSKSRPEDLNIEVYCQLFQELHKVSVT